MARLIGGNANPRGDSVKMSSPQPSPPTPPRPPITRAVGSPLRPQSTPIPSGATSNPRTRAVSQQSTPPSQGDSVRKTSSGPASVSTTSLPNPNQPDRNRSKARDLLRKHYGLGVGPPPPSGKPQDPMDLGKPAACCTLMDRISSRLPPFRFTSIRCQGLLRAIDHDFVISHPSET